MKLTVSRADLLNELRVCAAVDGKHASLPILGSVLLTAESGRLRIVATDLDLTVITSCEANVEASGSAAIDTATLTAAVRSLPAGDVAIEVAAAAIITGGLTRFELPVTEARLFPTVPEVDRAEMQTFDIALLQSLVARVLYAATDQDERFTLDGAFVTVKGGCAEAVATDGHRMALASAKVSKSAPELKVLVMKRAAKGLARLPVVDGGAGSIGTLDGRLVVSDGVRTILAVTPDANFPNHRAYIPASHDITAIVRREDMMVAIDRVRVVTDSQSRAIALTIRRGEITAERAAVANGVGAARDMIPAECSADKPLRIGFAENYLRDAASSIDAPLLVLGFGDADRMLSIRPSSVADDAIDQVAIVMPMRIPWSDRDATERTAA